ncbi:dTDP-4-amino-4,6-dideoxygalactose transaminase [Actinopolymorpha cephalotaxi]|uniref:dTDP-4-amino-4,6-dideoxygalactose transaminase n=1 Tax=Actinopolymorpha cephalotaxi TaxID=504797 RepID=A0A1I2WN94_9ACTN|nr:DegT/DnrJ/EryC1/StrS family aminotransferase [Actinopolymorpha cephalotaxi]NYH85045.1 dTDP-4-amino-4,6-dideoxygalactose transaminase [Actinopolymorpha cephalotaxi]SFH02735.1 dTDP-4-amino-4,6-dideoxygalactose transaminase [Actinopolymorpha cephalotaxi]
MTTVPFVDLRAAHTEIDTEVRAGFDRVLAATAFVKGPDVAAFEEEYAAFSGVAHCVGLGNGTDAIELALRAAGVGPGTEVVVPANTFVATVEAVVRAGARPVLVDVDKDTLLMDPGYAAAAIGRRTRAIVPVHLYGRLAPVAELLDLGPTVVEDAAQSQGAVRDGRRTAGTLAATSFYPGKNLGAYGDAGAVVTDSADLARAVRLLADHGSERKYVHETLGFNSRMDTLQAVVLRAKLRRLERWNRLRAEAAARYGELLAGLPGLVLPEAGADGEHVWHLYVVRVPDRESVTAVLGELDVAYGIHYPVPVHLTPAFRSLGYGAGDFPVTEEAAGQILSLPMFPQITVSQQEQVAQAVRKALG